MKETKENSGAHTNHPLYRMGHTDGQRGIGPSMVIPEYLAGYEVGRAEYLLLIEENRRMGWDEPWPPEKM